MSILTRDEQIEFARLIVMRIEAVAKILKTLPILINSQLEHMDSDVASNLGIIFDGAVYSAKCIADNVYDSGIGLYKTSDEVFLADQDKDLERSYENSKRSIFNEGKI